MSSIAAVKKSVAFGALLATFCGSLALAQNPISRSHSTIASRQAEFTCTGNDVRAGFPLRVRLKILSPVQIEASAFDRADTQTPASIMRRSELPNSPGAVFLMGGMLGVSGNATLSMALTALEMGEVGTILIQNHSTIESVVYLCSKIL